MVVSAKEREGGRVFTRVEEEVEVAEVEVEKEVVVEEEEEGGQGLRGSG